MPCANSSLRSRSSSHGTRSISLQTMGRWPDLRLLDLLSPETSIIQAPMATCRDRHLTCCYIEVLRLGLSKISSNSLSSARTVLSLPSLARSSSNPRREISIEDRFTDAHPARCASGFVRDRPSVVSSYSTRGGISAKAVRFTSPSLSSSRNVWVSIRWDIPGTALCSALNREQPMERTPTTRIVHLSPI